MKPYTGLLDKISIIKTSPLIIQFALITIHRPINCLLFDNDIAKQILLLEESKHYVVVAGVYNSNRQFIVTSFKLRDADKI